MFERYLTELLTAHFGRFVANMDPGQMRISAWRGVVVLEDVELRRDCVSQLLQLAASSSSSSSLSGVTTDTDTVAPASDSVAAEAAASTTAEEASAACPVEIIHGRVGRLELHIPWKMVRTLLVQSSSSSNRSTSAADASAGVDEYQTNNNNDPSMAMSLMISDVNILMAPKRSQLSVPAPSPAAAAATTTTTTDDDDDDDRGLDDPSPIATTDPSMESQCFTTEDMARREAMVQSAMDAELLRRVAVSSQPLDPHNTTGAAAAATTTTTTTPRRTWKRTLQGRGQALFSHISVTMQNIHIRYEDPGTSMGFVWPQHHHHHHHPPVPLSSSLSVSSWTHHPPVADESFRTCLSSSFDDQDDDDDDKPLSMTEEPIRYRPSFAIGVTLHELSISNTVTAVTATAVDSSSAVVVATGASGGMKRRRPSIVASVQQLAVYWDSNVSLMANAECHGTGEDWDETTTATRSEGSIRRKQRFEAFFARLNTGSSSCNAPKDDTNGLRHAYILFPISPAMQLDFAPVVPATTAAESTSSTSTSSNTLGIVLPPCRFTISRNQLGDLGYLRRSLAVWTHTQRGLLVPEATLRHLAYLRPKRRRRGRRRRLYSDNAMSDPRGWWNYACAAVLAVVQKSNEHPRKNAKPLHTPLRRCTGWVGLAQALGRRRRYTLLYRDFILAETISSRTSAQDALLCMERTLTISEIVAFRILSFADLRNDIARKKSGRSANVISDKLLMLQNGDSIHDTEMSIAMPHDTLSSSDALSAEHRMQMFVEMVVALHREQRNLDLQSRVMTETIEGALSNTGVSTVSAPAIWKLSMECAEFCAQVHDNPEPALSVFRDLGLPLKDDALPVVSLSCAFLFENQIYHHSSWKMAFRFGSLVLEDSTSQRFQGGGWRESVFPRLVGLKRGFQSTQSSENSFNVRGVKHHQNIFVTVQRSKWKAVDQPGSTITTTIRVLPLEVVYATAPFESLNHVFEAASFDFSSDYSRVATRLSAWRQRQQTRLLNALAHKRKKICVDVVVGAPVLLLPEGFTNSSPLLILDLGQLQFRNAEVTRGDSVDKFDDKWRLQLINIQLQSSSNLAYNTQLLEDQADVDTTGKMPVVGQLIEPFSLIFDVSTKILIGTDNTPHDHSSIRIQANLPRLAVNFTVSAFHLTSRLRKQWQKRRNERESSRPIPHRSKLNTGVSVPRYSEQARPSSVQSNSDARKLEVQFSAPFLGVSFVNDLARNDQNSDGLVRSDRLIDLAMKGTEGTFLRESSSLGISTSFTAKVNALGVVDSYQTAGDEYSLIMSSISPDLVSGSNAKSFDKEISRADLVTFDYKSIHSAGDEFEQKMDISTTNTAAATGSQLSIRFNELYIEWNPETIAAVNAALYHSPDTPTNGSNSTKDKSNAPNGYLSNTGYSQHEQDDEFYDADEDAFFDASSDISGGRRSPLLSEISDSEQSTEPVCVMSPEAPMLLQWSDMKPSLSRVFSPSDVPGSPFIGKIHKSSVSRPSKESPSDWKPCEIIFELSRLRVNFNKEARHRRLVTTEMEGTIVRRSTMKTGGSKTHFTIGNLTLSDCESANNRTLYREILGLKTGEGQVAMNQSSLLEMEMITKPRERRVVPLGDKSDDPTSESDLPVSVDYELGLVHGFDNFFQARFSPMRFVYLQQLWFEIIDYFFIAIVGYEVWGGKTPDSGDIPMFEGACVSADAVYFTRFDVSMESPILLFPVSSCSTDFVRLEASHISFRNAFNLAPSRPPSVHTNRQWFNNCTVEITSIALKSWSGDVLNRITNRPTANLSLCWPVGPSAAVNVPKWKVECLCEELELVLTKQDYALLQHIIQFNIGEESRHLEEWYALQLLKPEDRAKFMKSNIVHFGYDKKDATPSTFDVEVSVPMVSFLLMQQLGHDIAAFSCSNVKWKYEKLSDRVSKQNVACDLGILSDALKATLLTTISEPSTAKRLDSRGPDLLYSTATSPSGSSVKTLTITDSCVFLVLPAWRDLNSFFQNLPSPSYLSPHEAIQVGDRWYKIGERDAIAIPPIPTTAPSWLSPSLQSDPNIKISDLVATPDSEFRFSLIRPCIRVGSDQSALELSAESVRIIFKASDGLLQRDVDCKGVEVQSRSARQPKRSSSFSLVRPWNISCTMKGRTDKGSCPRGFHVVTIVGGLIDARATFSDIVVAVDATFGLLRDYKLDAGKARVPHIESDSIVFIKQHRLQAEFDGLQLEVVDDSGRHFAGEQKLLAVSLRKLKYAKCETYLERSEELQRSSDCTTHVHLEGIDVFDCLQLENSPFYRVISINQRSRDLQPTPRQDSTAEILQQNMVSSPFDATNSNVIFAAVSMWSMVTEKVVCGAVFSSIHLQYNPSFIVAIQRFLGRLRKEIRRKRDDVFSGFDTTTSPSKEHGASKSNISPYQVIRASVDVRHFYVRLNKEHQNRRLLDGAVTSLHIMVDCSDSGSFIVGHVGKVRACYPETTDNSNGEQVVLSCAAAEQNFITFRYSKFLGRSLNHKPDAIDIPEWVLTELVGSKAIDDFLDLSVGTLEVVYLRGWTAELIDYLSNGMPGKGMGATSRVAQGFVSDRFQKRSFFNVQVDAPRLLIPQGQSSLSGLSLRLGDLKVKSWVSGGESSSCRFLQVLLLGFSVGVYRNKLTALLESTISSDIDVSFDVKLAASGVTVSSRLSDLIVKLSYSDYVDVRRILRDNLARKMDTTSWENVEKAWANEIEDSQAEQTEEQLYSHEVSYSSSARLVRYGQPKIATGGKSTSELSLSLGNFSVVLRRDDALESLSVPYDMALFVWEDIEFEVGQKDDGDRWLSLSVGNIFAFDLGKYGRLNRALSNTGSQFNDDEVNPFSVLVEGYAPTDSDSRSKFESHLVIKIDEEKSPSGSIQAVIIVNYLSITAFVRPLNDLIQFFTLKFPTVDECLATIALEGKAPELYPSNDTKKLTICDLRVRFVSHYPRLVFAADEADGHSRALVIQGLSIANASLRQDDASYGGDDRNADESPSSTLSVNADFQHVSSHIFPDIAGIVSLSCAHLDILKKVLGADHTAYSFHNENEGKTKMEGVPVLLPLTIGVEFEQTTKFREAKKRALSICVDPLAVILSNEDVRLVRAILSAWASTKKPIEAAMSPMSHQAVCYDAEFRLQRLGLGLRKENGQIVVDNIAEPAQNECIRTGDIVHAINGHEIMNAETITLAEIVNRLSMETRPLSITFVRAVDTGYKGDEIASCAASTTGGKTEPGVDDTIDISLSSAVVTLVEKEVPLFRGAIRTTKVACRLARSSEIVLSLELSTALSIDYYNLHIWAWEPFVEPGIVYLSSSFQDANVGSKELAIEIGDRDEGLCLNLTDSLVETFSKALYWTLRDVGPPDNTLQSNGQVKDDVVLSQTERRDMISRRAANEAYRFAAKQKSGTAKPFLFRNRSGLSVAFVKQILNADPETHSTTQYLSTLGEYDGLQQFETSGIVVVGNNEEVKFYATVDSTNTNTKSNGQSDSSCIKQFPLLAVAIQKTNGMTAEPFFDLQIAELDEAVLPMKLSTTLGRGDLLHSRDWVSWLVEQEEEKTVLTIGSTIRFVSFLNHQIDVRMEEECTSRSDSKTAEPAKLARTVALRTGSPFYLPMWIAMQWSSWRCSIRLSPDHCFSPIVSVSPEGLVNFDVTSPGCIECSATTNGKPSKWLSVTRLEEKGVLTINIDCSISIRNLLPSSIDWEIMESSPERETLVDSSRLREMRVGYPQPLKSGEYAEILSNGWELTKLRVRPASRDCDWSMWTPISALKNGANRVYDKSDDMEDTRVTVTVMDRYQAPLPLAIRFTRKASGIDVYVYAELWCSNMTPLDVIFGFPRNRTVDTVADESKSNEMSVAEATLKEISALFDVGEPMPSNSEGLPRDVVRLSGQVAAYIPDECFEYVEMDNTVERQHWWASLNPFSRRDDNASTSRKGSNNVIAHWEVDETGRTFQGWESSPSLSHFSSRREFNSAHRYRRRRWKCRRPGLAKGTIVDGVNTFFQPDTARPRERDKKSDQTGIQVALQIGDGRFSLTSVLPRQGTVHGVIRATKSRWPATIAQKSHSADTAVFELSYTVSPLDGDWGLLTRCMYVTSRFLLRNDSKTILFEAKQSCASDSSAVLVHPGQTEPFHWGDFRLPELVCLRPVVRSKGCCVYQWSGGFDPLSIGQYPLRIRKGRNVDEKLDSAIDGRSDIDVIKMEAEIRPRTGGTGINISFQEEDATGAGALYRIDNLSSFPIWWCQDDVLANPSPNSEDEFQGDIVLPSESTVVALDVPFKQGKYAHRKEARLETLLRMRLSLAPLSTRAGVETTKMISLANSGATVRLNPSKLPILDGNIRRELQDVRVLGVISNDGPTRILTLRLMKKPTTEKLTWTALGAIAWSATPFEPSPHSNSIVKGARDAVDMKRKKMLGSEEAVLLATSQVDLPEPKNDCDLSKLDGKDGNLVISIRAAFSALVVSFVDSAPSEIAVATLKNMNAIATWDAQRITDATIYVTLTNVQVDNMVPNAPFPVAVCPTDPSRHGISLPDDAPPLLVVGLSFAPKHKSQILCLKSATIAPRNLSIKVDLAFLVRLQKFALELQSYFQKDDKDWQIRMRVPDIQNHIAALRAATSSDVGRQRIHFGGLTILPCNITLSVAPARALTPAQAALEGAETAAIHQAVRKGDVLFDRKRAGVLGVKVGSRNKTPLAVVRGMLKSFVVDGLLRLDGASLNFAGVSLRNYTSTGSQLTTALTAHYLASLRQNLPALLGSMAAFGNPLGLVRGLGEGVGDFVLEPVRGFQRSVQEMDASYLVDGVARGTLSLARHTVGGIADSAAMLAETFSKNMTVLTLDRRYAQKRDRGEMLRDHSDVNVASGLGSGVQKLVSGFLDGVTGVVKAPIRGAEKRGLEGFAKGVGKGLLGLLVKPIIGISDGFSDVMIGVKGTVDGVAAAATSRANGTTMAGLVQVRPRRALYGRAKAIRVYHFADAAACALMLRTRLAGEAYLSHLDMGDRVALLTIKRIVVLGRSGEELLVLKLKHIASTEVRSVSPVASRSLGWEIIVVLTTPRSNGSEVEIISCVDPTIAEQLHDQLEHGRHVALME